MKTPQEIEELFHTQIPITRAMGVRVARYDGEQLVLTAPLALNYNHLHTAFGGSLNALATLSGYGFLWLELNDTSVHIVIRESSIAYRKPVRGDLTAVCRRPPAEALEAFKADFLRKKKARIELTATIESEGKTAVEFSGSFVAVGTQSAPEAR